MYINQPTGDKKIYICVHCSEEIGSHKNFCKNCETASLRKEMDKNNKEINPNYLCRVCK